MRKSSGNNIFENNVFSWDAWSADILQTPRELREAMNSLNLPGNIISSIKAVGYAYTLGQYEPADKDTWSSEDKAAFVSRHAEIDEPLIISFSNGDRLEIDFSYGSTVRISKNCLPLNIKHCVNSNNFDAAKLFSSCLGEMIMGFEIMTTDRCPLFSGPDRETLEEERDDYIESMYILLSNAKKLKFEAHYDYGWVTAMDEANVPLKISFADLKLAC